MNINTEAKIIYFTGFTDFFIATNAIIRNRTNHFISIL